MALTAAALAGYVLYPTYPNYDSIYSLVWGREILHGHLPSFDAYRAPTEHPLWLAASIVLDLIFGDHADRALLLMTLLSFVGLTAGMYRLARVSFTAAVGFVAAALLCTRLSYPFLAARGYVDIPYLALVVWAAALEAARPRTSRLVWALLIGAGLLRPEAWVLLGLYALWRGLHARTIALAAIAPVVWVAVDWIATGHPLWSLQHTNELAGQLHRNHPASDAPRLMAIFLARAVKVPVLAGAALGLALCWTVARRRALWPFVLLTSGIGTFGAIALAGLAVIERYLAASALGVMIFCAFALAGFTLAERGSPLRRRWAWGAALVAAGAGGFFVTHVHPAYIGNELRDRHAIRAQLQRVLADPAVRAGRRCGPVTVPNHRLLPDTRWVLHAGAGEVLARSGLRGYGRDLKGVAILVVGDRMLRHPAYGPLGIDDSLLIQVPGPKARLVARVPDFAAYVTC